MRTVLAAGEENAPVPTGLSIMWVTITITVEALRALVVHPEPVSDALEGGPGAK